jgi:release factor glutamine methyltransferase
MFASLADYMYPDSTALMILCEGCDVEMIKTIAGENGFYLDLVYSKRNLFEKDFIFQIKMAE